MILINNFLSLEDCLKVSEDKNKLWKENCWTINKHNWEPNLTAGLYGSVYMTNVSPEINVRVGFYIDKYFDNKVDWDRTNIQHFVWDTNSGINWHNDRGYDFAGTIYINEHYNPDWGGIFEYFENVDSQQKHSICPEQGLFVINTIGQLHRVTKITHPMMDIFRHTIQIFGKFKDV